MANNSEIGQQTSATSPDDSPATGAKLPSFEASLKELEKLVAELERGDLPLENQLKAFERGVGVSRDCMKRLEEIERRVELLVTNGEGKLATAPFETGP